MGNFPSSAADFVPTYTVTPTTLSMPPNNPSHRGAPVQSFKSCSTSASLLLCSLWCHRRDAVPEERTLLNSEGPQLMLPGLRLSHCLAHGCSTMPSEAQPFTDIGSLLGVAEVSPGLRSRQQDCSQARFLGPDPRVSQS